MTSKDNLTLKDKLKLLEKGRNFIDYQNITKKELQDELTKPKPIIQVSSEINLLDGIIGWLSCSKVKRVKDIKNKITDLFELKQIETAY